MLADSPTLTARLYSVSPVRIFADGTFRGLPWTAADLQAMVNNYLRFRDQFRPPVGIGHEDVQPLADGLPATGTMSLGNNTGIPAYGTTDDLWTEVGDDGRTYLAATLADLPEWLAEMLAAKNYQSISVELYDTPPDGFEGAEGPILRRVCLLGISPPHVKGLGEIPPPELQTYGDGRRVTRPRRRLNFSGRASVAGRNRITRYSFAEEAPIPTATPSAPDLLRQQMIEMLTSFGVDQATLAGMDADEMAEMLRVLTPVDPTDTKPEDPSALGQPQPLPTPAPASLSESRTMNSHAHAAPDEARVHAFAESSAMTHALKTAAQTPADYLAVYKKAKAKDPSMTPEKFGVPAKFAACSATGCACTAGRFAEPSPNPTPVPMQPVQAGAFAPPKRRSDNPGSVSRAYADDDAATASNPDALSDDEARDLLCAHGTDFRVVDRMSIDAVREALRILQQQGRQPPEDEEKLLAQYAAQLNDDAPADLNVTPGQLKNDFAESRKFNSGLSVKRYCRGKR
jgi:hypothetical protein